MGQSKGKPPGESYITSPAARGKNSTDIQLFLRRSQLGGIAPLGEVHEKLDYSTAGEAVPAALWRDMVF